MSRRQMSIDPYFLVGVVSVLFVGAVYLSTRPSSTGLDSLPTGLLSRLDTVSKAHLLGVPSSPVHVVEIMDYQCPACAAAHRATWPVIQEHVRRGRVHYTVYDVPLPGHGNSIPAAVMAGCVASRNPAALWRFRDVLFTKQAEWSAAYPAEPVLLDMAESAGADTSSVRQCVQKEGARRAEQLRHAWTAMQASGITFVPVWMLNGRVVRWDRLADELNHAGA